MNKEYKMLQLDMEVVREHNLSHKNIVHNLLVANEMQLQHMAAFAPDYDMDNFPEGYPTIEWLEDTIAQSSEAELQPESPEYRVFASALTITAVTTRLPIPEEFFYMDVFVCEAVKELVVAHTALQEVKKQAEAKDGELMPAGETVTLTDDITRAALQATVAKMADADEIVVE